MVVMGVVTEVVLEVLLAEGGVVVVIEMVLEFMMGMWW